MIMDGLTKIGIYAQLMIHATTSIWEITKIPDKDITLRRTEDVKTDFSEQDLLDMTD